MSNNYAVAIVCADLDDVLRGKFLESVRGPQNWAVASVIRQVQLALPVFIINHK